MSNSKHGKARQGPQFTVPVQSVASVNESLCQSARSDRTSQYADTVQAAGASLEITADTTAFSFTYQGLILHHVFTFHGRFVFGSLAESQASREKAMRIISEYILDNLITCCLAAHDSPRPFRA